MSSTVESSRNKLKHTLRVSISFELPAEIKKNQRMEMEEGFAKKIYLNKPFTRILNTIFDFQGTRKSIC